MIDDKNMTDIIPDSQDGEVVDNRLRRLFHSGALQAPPSPWFTQNVLHRLPERKRCVASVVE